MLLTVCYYDDMNNKTFTITYENQILTNPKHTEALESLKQGIDAHITEFKLQARIMAYDVTHRTHFLKIRRNLLKERKQEQFITSIGLERISKQEQAVIDKRQRNGYGQFVKG